MTVVPSERSIVDAIIRWLRNQPDGHARKVHGSSLGTAGEPDIDGCYHGRSVKIEVKRPGRESTLTPSQRVALVRWRDAGAIVGVATSVDDVKELLYWATMNSADTPAPSVLDPDVVARTFRLLRTVRS